MENLGSVGLWLKHGWHVALAYVIGFFVMLAVLGWRPDAPIKKLGAAPVPTLSGTAPSATK